MLLGTRMTNNEPSAITDLDVVARYDATDPNYVIKDSLNRISALLDKSKRLTLGNELVVNGNFIQNYTYWDIYGTNVTVLNGSANFNNVSWSGINQTIPSIVAGKIYQIIYEVKSYTNGNLIAYIGNENSKGVPISIGIHKVFLIAGSQNKILSFGSNSATNLSITNISLREVLGNHITQTDTAKMPIHTNRYNLLTYSEDFSNAAWSKWNGSVQSNQIMSPIGTLTADKFVLNTGTGYIYQSPAGYNKSSSTAISVYLKHGGIDIIRVQISTAGNFIDVNLLNGTKVATNTISTIESVNNGWYKITMKYDGLPVDSTATTLLLIVVPPESPHLSGDSVYIWGAQLEQSNFVGKYQRVNAANDYDTNGFEYYALFDGVDDYLKSLPFTLNQPASIYSCLKQESWKHLGCIFDGISRYNMSLLQEYYSPVIKLYAGLNFPNNSNLHIGRTSNIITIFNGLNSKIKVNNTLEVVGSAGTLNGGGFTIGSHPQGSDCTNISVKEIIIKRIATDESDTIFNYFKNKHNVQY